MTLLELKNKFLADLANLYPKEEILSFYTLLVDFKLGISKIDTALNPNQIISKNHLDYFFDALTNLLTEKPIQYIIGETEFYGLPFYVNKHVLIPRPETEELVEWVISDKRQETGAKRQKKVADNILDIGTGSGCIAISLAKNLPNISVYAVDISAKALQIAKQNAVLNKVNVHFIEGNILNTNVIQTPSIRGKNLNQNTLENLSNTSNLKFDIIVSNPPYVRQLEKQEIKDNVLKHEPHLALFVENDNSLLFYDRIADFAKENLTKNGELYFEINQYLGQETVSLLKEKGFTNIELKKDLYGNDRMIKALFF